MREIKFRAWDAERRQYFYSDAYGLSGFFARHEDDPLEQFTGLADKNGKEIYEGDIFQEDSYKSMWNAGGERGVVEYKEGGFYPFLDYPIYTDDLISAHSMVVVGNIRENPDLMPALHKESTQA